MSSTTVSPAPASPAPTARTCERSFLQKLNAEWHERASYLFLFIVLAHWGEHLAQTFQIYLLGWKPPDARGVLGLWFPWLVTSEAMHYGYAVVMLAFFWVLRDGFKGRARAWWTAALVIQFWHHIEHAILQWQAIAGHNFWGKPVPFSFAQLIVPRVELHLIYNTIVFIPMVVATYYHLFPTRDEEQQHQCSCALTAPRGRKLAARPA